MNEPVAIYVHWPFCLAKCPYCDFNSHVRESINEPEMVDALLSEIDHFRTLMGNRTVGSVFFGGGTPSLMSARTVETVIGKIANVFSVSNEVEITLEANPTSVESKKFEGFAAAGVNRVSLGIQALNDKDLEALGREHSAKEALGAIELSQKHFTRSNFDLIYARVGQTISNWEKELAAAIDMANGHLSLYQLTMEPGTPFYGLWRKGELNIPDEETSAKMYEQTNLICAEAGLPAYEISNYAKIGEESVHNLTYWRYQDYIGVGAGAHGRITVDRQTCATEQNKKPETWLKNVQLNGHATKEMTPLDQKMMAEEMIMMGLRLTSGINHGAFEERIKAPLESFIDQNHLGFLKSQGFVSEDCPDRLQLTEKGRPLLNQILGRILA